MLHAAQLNEISLRLISIGTTPNATRQTNINFNIEFYRVINMQKLVPLLIVILSLLGCVSNKAIKENPKFYLGGFDGVFIGDLQQLKGSGYPFIAPGERKMAFMLVIRDDEVSIHTGTPGKDLKKVNFEKLHIIKHKTNAVIYTQESEGENYNEEDKGDWAETWNMTLTRKDENSVYVYLVRVVNNFRLAPETYTEAETGRFFYSWSGELQQVASIESIDD